jgi:hypothetical protein
MSVIGSKTGQVFRHFWAAGESSYRTELPGMLEPAAYHNM